jgi:TP901 family phage tail tape measure protein
LSIENEVFRIDFLFNDNLTALARNALAAEGAVHKLSASARVAQAQMASMANAQFLTDAHRAGIVTTQHTMESSMHQFGKAMSENRIPVNQMKTDLAGYRAEMKRVGMQATDLTSKYGRLANEQLRLGQSAVHKVGVDKSGKSIAQVVHQPVATFDKDGKDLAKRNAALKKFEAVNQARISRAMVNAGKQAQWAGRQLMVGLSLPIAALGYVAVKSFQAIDEQLVRLVKVYGSVTLSGKALEEQNERVRESGVKMGTEIAKAYGIASSETIGLMADIAATGKEGVELENATRETTRLMVLGEVDRQEAMSTTLSLTNAFGVANKDLANSVNYLNAVENQTSLSLQDMTIAIPKAGTVVKALGGDVKDLSLFMTAMKEGGVDAAQGANALKTGLARLTSPRPQSKKALAAFGIDMDQIIKDSEGDVNKLVFSFQAAIQKAVPDSQRAQVFEKVFGLHQYTKMLALFENLGKEGSQTIEVMRLMGASTQELAQKADNEIGAMTESGSVKFKRMVETLKAELGKFGEPFLQAATVIGGAFVKLFEGFNAMPDIFKNAVGFLLAIGVAVGPIIMLFGLAKNFVGHIQLGVQKFKEMVTGSHLMNQQIEHVTAESVALSKMTDSVANGMERSARASAEMTAAVRNLNLALERSIVLSEKQAVAQTIAFKKGTLQGMGGFQDSVSFINKTKPKGVPLFMQQAAMGSAGRPNEWVMPGTKVSPTVTGQAGQLSQISTLNTQLLLGKKLEVAANQKSLNLKQLIAVAEAKRLETYRALDTAMVKEAVATTTSTVATEKVIVSKNKFAAALQRASAGLMGFASGKKGKFAAGGIGMGAMMGSQFLPESDSAGMSALGGGLMGVGMGSMFGPMGMAIGGGAGLAIGGISKQIEQLQKLKEQAKSTFTASNFAASKYGVTLKSMQDVDLESNLVSFKDAASGAQTEVAKLREEISNQADGGIEKMLAEKIRDAPNNGEAINDAVEYATTQIAAGIDPSNVKKIISAIVGESGRIGIIQDIMEELSSGPQEKMGARKLKLESIKRSTTKGNGIDSAFSFSKMEQNDLADVMDNLILGNQALRDWVSTIPGIGKAFAIANENTEDFLKSAKAVSEVTLNSTIDEWKAVSSSINMTDRQSEQFMKSMREADPELAAAMESIGEKIGGGIGGQLDVVNAMLNGVVLNIEKLKGMSREQIQIEIDVAYRAQEVMSAATSAIMSSASDKNGKSIERSQQITQKKHERAQKSAARQQERIQKQIEDRGAQHVATIERQGERKVAAIERQAKQAERASNKAIRALERQAERESKMLSDQIERTRDRYDAEIDSIEKAEDARQKAFDAEEDRVSQANDARSMEIDYLKAINTGNFFDAEKIRANMEAVKNKNARDAANKVASESASGRVDSLSQQRDTEVSRLEKELELTERKNERAIKGAQKAAKAEQRAYKKRSAAAKKSYERQAAAAEEYYERAAERSAASYDRQSKSADKAYNKSKKSSTKAATQQEEDAKWVTDKINQYFTETGGDIGLTFKKVAEDAEKNGKDIGKYLRIGLNAVVPGLGTQVAQQISDDIANFPWANLGKYIDDKIRLENAVKPLAQNIPKNRRGKATGGILVGPGTGTSDSIPIMASNGEYVIRESMVKKYGIGMFDSINSGQFSGANSFTPPKYNMGGPINFGKTLFAGGGEVRSDRATAQVASELPTVYNINVMFGRTSATQKDIYDTVVNVMENKNARTGRR